MRRLRNKRGATWLEVIFLILLMLVLVALVLSPSGIVSFFKKLFGLEETIINPYESCHGLADGTACQLSDKSEGICQNAMCVELNRPASTQEHAKALFKSTLKQSLLLCKDDVTKCDSASEAILNILSYVDNDDEGNVYIIIQNIQSTSSGNAKSEFKLYKKKGFFSFGSGVLASFQFPENICLHKGTKLQNTQGRFGIGKLPEGVKLFDPNQVTNTKHWYPFVEIAHKDISNAETPLCIHYSDT